METEAQMGITAIFLMFAIGTVFSAFCLWAGMKLTKVHGTFLAMLIIAAISAALDFIPMAGWLISTVVMFVLICKWTDAEFWPDAILMVIVAKVVAILGGMIIIGALMSSFGSAM